MRRPVGAVILAATAVLALIPATSSSAAPRRSATPVVSLSLPGLSGGQSHDVATLMTAVLQDADAYWTDVFAANDLAEPRVRYAWIPAGRSVVDGCSGQPTGETAAFYCPADDTIYVAQRFAAAVRSGAIQGWPSGDRVRRALGDMAVAYIVAHEQAHNVQDEIGLFDQGISTRDLELHADCLAGAWAGDAARRGVLDTHDAEIGQVTAWLVGDYAFEDPSHHGTPTQRRQAFADGFHRLGSCARYV
jgi:predicted metalloprotease